MTITRIWQAGGELNTALEYEFDPISGVPTTFSSTANEYTGARSIYFGSTSCGFGCSFPAAAAVRGGLFLYRSSTIYETNENWIVRLETSGGTTGFKWNSAVTIDLVIDGITVDTWPIADTGVERLNTQMHIGFTFFADAATGYASLYVDGVQVAEVTGNTGTSTITEAYYGTPTGAYGAFYGVYYDDAYIDVLDSEVDVPPPALRFYPLRPSGAGSKAQWTPVSGDNYTNVDDDPGNDGLTTAVSAETDALQDLHVCDDITLPIGYRVAAVIPMVIAKASEVGPQVKLLVRENSTTSTSAARDLTTAFSLASNRIILAPDTDAWTEVNVNAMEIGYQSVI